jgi:hypothetical protein
MNSIDDGLGTPQRELSFGEKACGVSFNPSGNQTVQEIKESFAKIIDHLNYLRVSIDNPEIRRMLSVAITEAQTSQMWAVKAVTWQH